MTTLVSTRSGSAVLADLVPGRRTRDVALVLGGAGLIGVAAQIAIPLPFTPVPITLQTLAVLLAGAALGPLRGLATTALYLVAGGVGVPWFTDAGSGWGGASFGYVVGFLLASTLVGWLARRRTDRDILPGFGAMIVANMSIYLVGVPWLMATAHLSLGRAVALGLTPFLVGDAIKTAIAAGLLPAAWQVVGARRD
jgi:biotin transport system substrate-specific component